MSEAGVDRHRHIPPPLYAVLHHPLDRGQPDPQPETSGLQSPYHWLLLVAFPQSPRRLVAGIVMAVATAPANDAAASPACISIG